MKKVTATLLAMLAAFAFVASDTVAGQMLAQISSPAPAQAAIPGYRAFKDETVAPWREVNDKVGRIGGWKVYAKERTQVDSTQSAPASGQKNAGAIK